MLLFNILFIYVLFRWAGFKGLGIFFVVLIGIKELVQLLFLWRLEKRIFKPINELKKGFEEIVKGNYNVKIDCAVENEFGHLIRSFNEMANKLLESERINLEYEENRKTLVANISHDLKTPITSIQGYLEILLDENFSQQSDKNKSYLKTIYLNTAYINKLIDDLFLFSKLDMAKMDFHFEILKISAYMRDLIEEFRFELEEKHFQLIYTDLMEQDYLVNIDGKRLYQAIRNIIGNAVKYGPEKDLIIRVELSLQADLTVIKIKDNGAGIPEDKLPYIFNRFYRIDTERSKDFMSTGLGLTIAKELVEGQGGKISVTSSAETGTCFTICFPTVQ